MKKENKNKIVFWELASHYAETSVKFFEEVFEWKFNKEDDSPVHEMENTTLDRSIGGGVFTLRKAKLPFLTVYIAVEDIDSMAKKVTAAGGHIIEAPHEIVIGTKICLFNEPSGVTFAMLERV